MPTMDRPARQADISTVDDVDEWYSNLRDMPAEFIVTPNDVVYLAWVDGLDGRLVLWRLNPETDSGQEMHCTKCFHEAFRIIEGGDIIDPLCGWEDPRLERIVRLAPLTRDFVDTQWCGYADDVWMAIQRARAGSVD